MADIGRWLEGLGLGKYAAAFAEAEIDLAALPHLTENDLKELGLPIGPRRKILAAAPTAPGQSAPAIASTAGTEPVVATPRDEAERRQLTVMFVDLIQSTEHSTQLDPEDMRDLLRDYQNVVTGEIARFGGHVAKLMGDGVLAYFGWPLAHEDSAERAVRAGLALSAAVARLRAPSGQALATRTGIATGLVVVGELIGEAEAQERTVVGETPNLAARLQSAAEPGTVVIANGTRRLLGTLFEVAETPPLELKGIKGRQHAWIVIGEGRAESRFDAMHATGFVPLVGREQELALLLDRWRRAKSGEGQVVLLSGEPGIGKSRIVVALRDRLRKERPISMRYFCSPQHTGTPLWPIIGQLERAARFAPEDSAAVKLEKLEALLRPTVLDGRDEIALFADLLSIPVSGRFAPLELTAEEKKARIMRSLVKQLETLSRRRPVLVLLEDAHWLDPTSRQAFDLIIDAARSLSILCVVTCRPEFEADWVRQPHVTQLSLNRLSPVDAERIIAEVAHGRIPPGPLMNAILAKTEGVPLFVEELTKMVLESDLFPASGDHPESAGRLAPLMVPDTLRDSLMARLDRFPAARAVAQIGAVLGREFTSDLLASVADLPEATLNAALEQLVTAGLVFRRGASPNPTFTFKHALVQDTAYQSLLKTRRQQLHARVAEALRASFAERIAGAPELLAHHLTEAGFAEDAVEAWLDTVAHDLRRSAYAEATGHLRRGLAVAGTLPPSLLRDSAEMRLNSALGQVIHTSQGPVAEVEARYRRARELAQAAGNEREWTRASFGLWFCQNWRMEHHAARKSASGILHRVAASEDSALALQAHHAVWTTSWQLGEAATAVEHAEIGRSIYDPDQHHAYTAVYGSHDAGVCCCNTLGIARTMLGHLDRGVADAEAGEALARRVEHPFSRTLSLFFRSNIRLLRGETEIASRLASEMRDLCAQQGIVVYGLVSRLVAGTCASTSGADPRESMRLMREALDELARIGARARRTEYLGWFAECALAAGENQVAGAALMEAKALSESTGERFFAAELYRIGANLCLAEGDRLQAEQSLNQALVIARSQSLRLFEVRAAAGLAKLMAERGDRRKALELLSPIHGWFTEGLETPHLREVGELCTALA